MRYSVPQFIEYETKIVGPLTWKQSLFIGIPGAICFILYLTLAKTNFPLFIFLCLLLIGGGATLAFVRIGGRSLPVVFINFLRFNISPKIYLWTKGEKPIMVLRFEKKKIEKKEELPLKIAEGSRLKKVKIQVETQTK